MSKLSERSQRARSFLGLLVASALAAGCGGAEAPDLLLLVTVDTLRADELGAYGSPRGLTPRLDALAADSVLFERAYAPASFTLPSIATLLTGRYPEELGIRDNESGLPASVPTLATELAGRGWRTAGVVGNFVLRRASGVARGFEAFDDAFRQVEAVRRWPERVALDTTEAALAQLADCTGGAAPCFLWVHYQDPHGPYDPPGERRAGLLDVERAAPGGQQELPIGSDHLGFGSIPAYQALDDRRDVAWYRAGYRGEIQYVDQEVGRLLAAVDAAGLRDRSIVVFAADHGEALGEQDVWFAHGSRLGDEQVRVPLLLRVPGVPPGRRSDVVSLRDVYPTLLSRLAGRAAAEELGRDLLAAAAPAAHSEPYMATLGATPQRRYAIVADGYKLVVVERNGVYDSRLYRLGREDVDLSPAAPQIASALRDRLDHLRSRLERRAETPQELSDADRARLRALGYDASPAEPERASNPEPETAPPQTGGTR